MEFVFLRGVVSYQYLGEGRERKWGVHESYSVTGLDVGSLGLFIVYGCGVRLYVVKAFFRFGGLIDCLCYRYLVISPRFALYLVVGLRIRHSFAPFLHLTNLSNFYFFS